MNYLHSRLLPLNGVVFAVFMRKVHMNAPSCGIHESLIGVHKMLTFSEMVKDMKIHILVAHWQDKNIKIFSHIVFLFIL